MSADLIVLVIVVATALVFDFTNGFHDTANAVASSIATGALRPRTAVALSALLNLAGAFLSVEVARTVANGIVSLSGTDRAGLLTIVFAGLTGGIIWNLLTWLLGLPSSSSHALFGGLIGATLVALGGHGVIWSGVVNKVLIPALLAPLVAGLVAAIGTWMVYRIGRGLPEERSQRQYRWGQIGGASLISLAHGTNDAQKTMGVIFLALVAHGTLTENAAMPFWVKLACALAIAAGTYVGGWRIIRTLGKGLVDIHSPQGLAVDTASATVILTSSHLGLPLSTTQTVSGSVMGSGLGRGAKVRWSVAGQMGLAWLCTLPLAGLTGAACWLVANAIGGLPGVLVVLAILIGSAFAMWIRSRRNPVHTGNVTDDWDESEQTSIQLKQTA